VRQTFETCKPLILAGCRFVSRLTVFETASALLWAIKRRLGRVPINRMTENGRNRATAEGGAKSLCASA